MFGRGDGHVEANEITMNKVLKGSVALPGSKSESNRALMIAAYGGFPLRVANLSDAHDTLLLQQLLQQINHANTDDVAVVDCQDAGTAARFLLTYLACHKGRWILTGSERMRQRPMKPLVEALMQLGADIEYQGEPGFLPLVVNGRPLAGGMVTIDASQSSQFVSSLLLAAPYWENGLQLRMEANPTSLPYIGMSMAIMRHFGASVRQEECTIMVDPKPFQSTFFEIEADWSAASYWYELAALAEDCELLLKGLKKDSLQGDRTAVSAFEALGVNTHFTSEGAWLSKSKEEHQDASVPLCFNLKDTPDLFPALFVTCIALGRDSVFHDIGNLALKESNRVVSIDTELKKLYTYNNIIDNNFIVINNIQNIYTYIYGNDVLINTYNDHRIAMAMAPLTYLFLGLNIDRPEVVGKSYPNYWAEFHRLTL